MKLLYSTSSACRYTRAHPITHCVFTNPYSHPGRIVTLVPVLYHYNSDIYKITNFFFLTTAPKIPVTVPRPVHCGYIHRILQVLSHFVFFPLLHSSLPFDLEFPPPAGCCPVQGPLIRVYENLIPDPWHIH